MPHIAVSVTAKPDPTIAASIAEKITRLTHVHLQKDRAVTAVAITFVEPENWFVGGGSLASQGKASFWLDIKVTDGTNIKAQLAVYIEAVFQEMTGLIGPVHETSYVLVHEVPAPAWGYGGKTQEYRFIAGRISH